jgi:hypothetical protein
MSLFRIIWGAVVVLCTATTMASVPASAQQGQKPNILIIMGDDIGWMQPSIYHRGLMVGETPNIDRIGNEGAIFMDYVAMQSCTSGRNAFYTGMYPLRTGMIPPQLPGSPSYLRPGTLGLSLSPRRHAGGELPRHQQDSASAGRCAALQEHADPGPPRSARRGGSEDYALSDAATASALVQIL